MTQDSPPPSDDSSLLIEVSESGRWASLESTVEKLGGVGQPEPSRAREVFAAASRELPGPGEPGAGVPKTLGRFRLIRELGRGRFGIVYLARDDQLDRDVAIKVARPEVAADHEQRQRFGREAELAAGLHHPGIVPIHEVGVEGPWLFIVMGLCDGDTLAEWGRGRNGKINPAQAARIVRQIAVAVAHGHQNGVVHRDLKPSNIGVIEPTAVVAKTVENASNTSAVSRIERHPTDPEIRVYDFGFSCGADLHLRDTRTSLSIGTPLYMAPEQLRGSDVTAAADVYAIGTILYELLTSKCPFEADTQPEVLHKLWHDEPEPVRSFQPLVSKELEAVCLKALSKRPEERYADASELADDLGRWLRGLPTSARPLTPLRSFRLWSERANRVREAGAVVLTQHLVLPAWSVFGQLGPESALGDYDAGELISPQVGTSVIVHLLFFYVGYRLWANRPSQTLMRVAFVIAFILVPIHLARGLGWLPAPNAWYEANPDMRWLIFWLMSLTAGIDLIALAVAMRSDRRARLDRA